MGGKEARYLFGGDANLAAGAALAGEAGVQHVIRAGVSEASEVGGIMRSACGGETVHTTNI